MLAVPYLVYGLLVLMVSTTLGINLESSNGAISLPYGFMGLVIVGELFVRGLTFVLLGNQFRLTPYNWRQWWVGYVLLSLVFSMIYLGVFMYFSRGMDSVILQNVVLFVAMFVSVVVMLFVPLVMFFHAENLGAAFLRFCKMLRGRWRVIFQIVLTNIVVLLFCIIVGAFLGEIPIIGPVLNQMAQAFGQVVALIYSFVVFGEDEFKNVLFSVRDKTTKE